jgi:hypothetical protein
LRRESIEAKVQPAASDDRFLLGMNIAALVLASALLLVVDLVPSSLPPIPKVLYSTMMGILVTVFLVGIVYAIYRLLVRWTQFFRAKQFAAVNRMTYAVSESKPTWDSLLFDTKVAKSRASNVFTATSEPVFEAGNYHYENWAGRRLIGTDWGYVVVDLGRPVPPLVLRSTSRRSARRWGNGAYSHNPVLPLGGFADRRYRLYCPAGAEDEARRLFTPQLIAALNGLGRSIDVEVSGTFLFVYSSRRFPFPRPRSVTAAFSVISLVSSLARTA